MTTNEGVPRGEDRSGASPVPQRELGPIVLKVKGLRTFFFTYDGIVRAIDGVNFQMRGGETLGLVGETGCGKSVTAFSITRLIPDPPGRVIEGEVRFQGANLLWGLPAEAKFTENRKTHRVKIKRKFGRIREGHERMSAVRGTGIAMIFQEPTQAMNPIFSIADQVGEAILIHRGREVVEGLLGESGRLLREEETLKRRLQFGSREPKERARTRAELSRVRAARARARPRPATIVTDTKPLNQAIAQAVEAGTRRDTEGLRAPCRRIGELVGVQTVGTEIYYLVRDAPKGAERLPTQILRHLQRLRPNSLERSYLIHRHRLMETEAQLHEVYLSEMKEGKALGQTRRRLGAEHKWERWKHFYFGLWGIRTRVQRTLKQELFWRTVGTLETVSIANPVQVAKGYPHELSGGMVQRVMIAMALAPDPALLIADEPTTALDVTVQAQILELMRELKARVGSAILLITHDLAVVAEVADRVCIMYAGQIVEQGPVREIYRRPLHPYAQGLLASIPRLDQPEKELSSIPGSVPNLINPPTGCRFHPRCPYAMPVCKSARPPMTVEGPEHTVACYLYKGPVASE